MWILRIAAFVTAAAAIATWTVHDVLEARYIGYPFGISFYVDTAHPLTLLGMQALIIAGFVLCVGAIVHALRKHNPARFSAGLFYAAFALVALGVGVTLQSIISYQKAFAALGEARFELYAPSIMTQLFILGLALWPAAFVFILLLFNRDRTNKTA
ncbi:hypothetical protein [Brevundimonas sp.]|uniref:hypothetical protein n=1 Tax=Brevundimonas sp. TaxID=1871086 RepID=UPI00289D9309|nr:hypothetical protein [Brevundimonas sp.]